MTKNTVSTIMEIFSLEQIDILINAYFSRLERLIQVIIALVVLLVFFATIIRRKEKQKKVVPYVTICILYCLRLTTFVPKIDLTKIPFEQLSGDVEMIKRRSNYYRGTYEDAVESLDKLATKTSSAISTIDQNALANHAMLVGQTNIILDTVGNLKQQITTIFDNIDDLVVKAQQQLQNLQQKKHKKNNNVQKYKKNRQGDVVVASSSSSSMISKVDSKSIKYSAFKKDTLDIIERILKHIQLQLHRTELELGDIIYAYNNNLPNKKVTEQFLDRTIQKLNQKETILDSMQSKIFKMLQKPILYATDNLDESTERLIVSIFDGDSSFVETLTNEVIGSLPTSLGNIGKQYRVSLKRNKIAFPIASTMIVDSLIVFDQKILLALLFAINGGLMFSDVQEQEGQMSIQIQQVSKQQFQKYKQKQNKKNKQKFLLDF